MYKKNTKFGYDIIEKIDYIMINVGKIQDIKMTEK